MKSSKLNNKKPHEKIVHSTKLDKKIVLGTCGKMENSNSWPLPDGFELFISRTFELKNPS